ncbi:MAG: YsnF/AvaK domain-containing protein [Pseudomonadota bacterium]
MFGWLKGERKTLDDLPILDKVVQEEAKFKDKQTPDETAQTVVKATIPLVEEQAVVGKRTVAGDIVRVEVETLIGEETISEHLHSEIVDVTRVAVDRPVTERPAVRREGKTTIIPVVRERLVLKKELVLTEEIHITRERVSETVEQSVELRHQTATVTRNDS